MRFHSISAVAALLALFGCTGREPGYPKAPVILISIDTLRADHLPAYGYREVETPAIDRLRKDSILFENAYAQVPLTLPSHISMLTGELPVETGVRDNIGYVFDAAHHETIPSLLHKHGYRTGAAVSAYVLRGPTGIRGAFDFYDDDVKIGEDEAQGDLQRAGAVTEASAERWIASQGEHPFFFLLHLYEPHSPYTPPEPFRSRFKLPYDGEIATADAVVGKFIDFLKRRGIYDRAVLILMSDHGEGLLEHGEQEHGIFLYREVLHVPLLLKLPENEHANQSVIKPVGLIDIFPTIARLAGIDAKKAHGTSLLSNDVRPQYAETLYPRIHLGLSDLRSLIDGDHHFIQAPKPEMYDFRDDPQERTSVIDSDRRAADSMMRVLNTFNANVQRPSPIDLEEAKKISALGYLTSATSKTGPLPDPKDHIGEVAALQNAARREAGDDFAGAIAAYRAVLKQNPNFTDAWILLAKAQEKSRDLVNAIDSRLRVIQLAPELEADNATEIASMSLALGRLTQAEEYARLAIHSSGSSSAAVVVLARAFVAGHRYDEAIRLLGSLHGQPVAFADFVRGDALARSGQSEEAKAALTREIRNFPKERQPYASLAVLYWLDGNRAAAHQTLESFIRANPGRGSLLFAGKTLEGLGDEASAAAFQRRAAAQ